MKSCQSFRSSLLTHSHFFAWCFVHLLSDKVQWMSCWFLSKRISLSPVQQFAWALFRLARVALILQLAPFLDPRFVTNNSLIRFFWNRVSPQHSVWLKPWFMLKSRWMADLSDKTRCVRPFPCRCSFSIKNPLQSKGFRSLNGEGGIRTLDRVAPIQHFQCCAFDHSATSPVAEVRM